MNLNVKVPQITAPFWIIKILTTGMGEALADYFDHLYEPVLVVLISMLFLGACLLIQMASKSFVAWYYWAAVAMVSVFGTLAADAVHVLLQVPYWASSIVFLLLLVALFAYWRVVEGQVPIVAIDTRLREVFYWSAVMLTFALGTAAGDMTAITFNWGFLVSGLIFAVCFAVPLLAYIKSSPSSVFAFWCAYILTRPLGASFADWLALPGDRGGLDYGTLAVSLALIALIAIFIILDSLRKNYRTRNQIS